MNVYTALIMNVYAEGKAVLLINLKVTGLFKFRVDLNCKLRLLHIGSEKCWSGNKN